LAAYAQKHINMLIDNWVSTHTHTHTHTVRTDSVHEVDKSKCPAEGLNYNCRCQMEYTL